MPSRSKRKGLLETRDLTLITCYSESVAGMLKRAIEETVEYRDECLLEVDMIGS